MAAPRTTVVMLALVVLCARTNRARAQDWHVVERHSTTKPALAEPGAAAAAPAVPARDGTFAACGEEAKAPGDPYKTIVSQLNDMWGTSFQVYESPKAGSPHARNGGCIFYNQQFLNSLFAQWMRIDDPDAIKPMLYAIFAHELGHLAHSDFDPANENVPIKNKELAADQFAGYSLQRMGLRRLDPVEVTRYYQLTGDDFVGRDSGHGNSGERTTAFQDGWHRAELGLSEQGTQPAGGLGEP
jgi:hypothetical protein